MAIGTLAAIGIGLAGVGSAVSGMSKASAAKKATAAAQGAQTENNALARDIYGQNQQALSPYMQRGNAAGGAINDLLGLGGGQQQTQQMPNALAQFSGPQTMYQGENPDSSGGRFGVANRLGQLGVAGMDSSGFQQPPSYGGLGGGQQQQTGQQAQNSAFDNFRNSTGYQFRLGEGMNAVNSGYAGAGTLQSGAALKAVNEYGQNFASNEFGNYMGYLGNQQGVGLSGASALAGVGQNYANSVMANNNNAADAVGNAALIKGGNNPFANALGTVGGGLFKLGS